MELDITAHLENCLQWKAENESLFFSRFLDEQEPAYLLNGMYRNGYHASTGIRLRFVTNGDFVRIKGNVSAEKFGPIGFFTQKVTHYQLRGKAKTRIPPKSMKRRAADIYSEEAFELLVNGISQEQKLLTDGTLEFRFGNSRHEKKELTIYFPQHARAELKAVEVNGDIWPAEKKNGIMIAFGDSITSGSLGQKASNSYVMTLAENLGMNVINQGVPGYTFQSDSLCGLERCPIKPDLITVAYGTNDWGFCSTKKEVDSNIKAYFQRLNEIFSTVRKVVITPIWRVDEAHESHYGSLQSIRETIRREAETMDHVSVIPGEDLLPKELRYLRDGYVHPGDEGQKLYGKKLSAILLSQL